MRMRDVFLYDCDWAQRTPAGKTRTGKESRSKTNQVLTKLNAMTEQEWLKRFDESKQEFKWFIDQYFPGNFSKLEHMRNMCRWSSMLNLMNDMWYKLPDDKFNIVEKPKGWSQYVSLLEDPPASSNGSVGFKIG